MPITEKHTSAENLENLSTSEVFMTLSDKECPKVDLCSSTSYTDDEEDILNKKTTDLEQVTNRTEPTMNISTIDNKLEDNNESEDIVLQSNRMDFQNFKNVEENSNDSVINTSKDEIPSEDASLQPIESRCAEDNGMNISEKYESTSIENTELICTKQCSQVANITTFTLNCKETQTVNDVKESIREILEDDNINETLKEKTETEIVDTDVLHISDDSTNVQQEHEKEFHSTLQTEKILTPDIKEIRDESNVTPAKKTFRRDLLLTFTPIFETDFHRNQQSCMSPGSETDSLLSANYAVELTFKNKNTNLMSQRKRRGASVEPTHTSNLPDTRKSRRARSESLDLPYSSYNLRKRQTSTSSVVSVETTISSTSSRTTRRAASVNLPLDIKNKNIKQRKNEGECTIEESSLDMTNLLESKRLTRSQRKLMEKHLTQDNFEDNLSSTRKRSKSVTDLSTITSEYKVFLY